MVSKPVLCVWNPCQNQLKYWWNLYFSNFVHWKMVYAVAALQDLQILQRSKICAHFSDLTKRIQNQCHWYVYIHVYVCDLNKRNMRKFYDAFQRVHLGSKVWNKLQSARKRCGKVEIRVSRQVGVRINRLSKSTKSCWLLKIWNMNGWTDLQLGTAAWSKTVAYLSQSEALQKTRFWWTQLHSMRLHAAIANTRPKRVCFCGRNTGHGTSFWKAHACVRQLPAGAMHVPRGTGYCQQERVRTAVIWRKYVGTVVR